MKRPSVQRLTLTVAMTYLPPQDRDVTRRTRMTAGAVLLSIAAMILVAVQISGPARPPRPGPGVPG